MIEVKKILAPTDFSDHARGAVKWACLLAEKFGAELHLLHVLPEAIPAGPDLMLAPSVPPDFYGESEARADEALRKVIDPAWAEVPAVAIAVRWGSAVEGVTDYAEQQGVDLIVVATHGRTGLSHVLLGSVAERIVREAPCPVLTIRLK
jgi:universal stress protein A